MKDLTCESPQCFNIRCLRRGVWTKKTKRVGGTIHCIMAFKKVEESFLLSTAEGETETDYYNVPDISLSEVEDLDSADSDHDYPDARGKVMLDLTIDLDKINLPEIDCSNSSRSGQPEANENEAADAEPTTAASIRRSGTFTKEAPSVKLEVTRRPSTDSESSVDSSVEVEGPNLTVHLHPASNGPSDETYTTSPASGLRRSGTFTKDTPTVSVQRTRPSSNSEYDSDSSVDHDINEPSEDEIKRCRTFIKSSNPSRLTSNIPLSDGTDSSSDAAEYTVLDSPNAVISGLKRSDTFTKEQSGIPFSASDDARCSSTTTSTADCPVSTDGLNKSDTFRERFSVPDEPSVDLGAVDIDVDLDDTLKATDFVKDNM